MNMRFVILCGGSGSRLWPESRENLPKQFITLIDEKSLLDLTIERFISTKNKTKPIFICNKKHGFLVRKSLKKYNLKADIFLEPEGKNTCAAIYLAAKHCSTDDNLIIMPSDHLISNKKKFLEDISNIEKSLTSDYWVTLGIKPTKASEAYGYIKASMNNEKSLLQVSHFIEKPSKEVAAKLISDDRYFWNAGIFIANVSMILNSTKKHAPNIAKHCDNAFDKIKINYKTNEFNFSKSLFSKIPSQSIDYAVMEHEKNIYLYPFNSEWSDVGSWDSVAKLNIDRPFNDRIIQVDSKNNFIRSENRLIATIGVKDLIIVDSDNATLISKKNQSENVKLVVNKLLKKNIVEAKEHSFENRPWGRFENLLDNKLCKVKKITVSPKKRLSLQYHNFRSEHWLVVYGTANVYLDGKNFILSPGQSIDIPLKSHHYLENKKTTDLIVIETQLGTYFGEDDIVRLDDPYFR
jgi:mannose-1-phosphate guanylyltransferase/mannose-6-phosphate isomerase